MEREKEEGEGGEREGSVTFRDKNIIKFFLALGKQREYIRKCRSVSRRDRLFSLLEYKITMSTNGHSHPAPPILLTIAGFDPSCGAGTAADLKTFAAHGCYGVAAITSLTVQNTQGVESVHNTPTAA